MKIAMANTKGGVAKTTSAVYIATELANEGKTGLFDSDPQGSASGWIFRAEDAGLTLPFDHHVVNLRNMERAMAPYEHAVIDTPPGDSAIIDAAIKAADLVLIPTESSPMDIQRVWPTIEAANAAGKPCAVLLVKTRANTISLATAVQTFEEAGVAVLDSQIPLREEIKTAFGTIPTNDCGYSQVVTDLLEVHNASR